MLSHIYIGSNDSPRAFAFYAAVMDTIGARLKFSEPGRRWAGWMPARAERPLFLVGIPFDGKRASPGNGQMTALLAPSRGAVDFCYKAAIAHGGSCDGPPGLRPEYHPNYYGAYFRDPDGNKICVCCHD